MNTNIYKDIEQRTGGDIYIGVVGPVRTGKSTLIKRFMDLMVIPEIHDEYAKARIIDELPQSGSGKTVMTTQPKFIPNEAIELSLGENEGQVRLKMIDCVGYMVNEAIGGTEEEMPRMVRTPWFDYDIPFEEAAEIGTRKVITEHSTIGIVVITDGSITGISRSNYEIAEEKVINEINLTNKPYIILLNSINPNSEECIELSKSLTNKYGVLVTPINVMTMTDEELNKILENILMEFPMRCLCINYPRWLNALNKEHPIIEKIKDKARTLVTEVERMKDLAKIYELFSDLEDFKLLKQEDIRLGTGTAVFNLEPSHDVFYRVLSHECNYEIKNELELINSLKEFVIAKKEYDRISDAVKTAEEFGYGLVPPEIDAMKLDKPEIVQQGSRFGVRLKAHASGLHIIRVDIESEVNPLVGTVEQSEELVNGLMQKFEKSPDEIWSTNIFGKSLYELVKDGVAGKVSSLPQEVQLKIQNTINRMVNEGCNSLICILL